MRILIKMAALSRLHSHYLALLVSAVLIVLALVFAILRLSYPSDGTRLWLRVQAPLSDAVVVIPLLEHSGGLRANDCVVSVAGFTIQAWLQTQNLSATTAARWSLGQMVLYSVIRDGTEFDIPITLDHFPLALVVLNNFGFIFLLAALEVEAVWIWLQRKHETAPQTLLLAAAAFGAFSICWYLGPDVVTFIHVQGVWLYFRLITFVMLMVASAALLHFAVLLPRLHTRQRIQRRLVTVIYLAPYPLYLAYIALCYSPSVLLWMRQWEIGVQVLLSVYFILALIAILSGYRSLSLIAVRRRVEIILTTFILAAFMALIFGVIQTFVTGQPWLGWGALPLLALPIAVGMGIAVVVYRLFDIRVVIQRTVVWSTLTGLIVAVYIVIVGGLSTLFQTQGSPIFALIATGLTAVLFHPLRLRLNRAVSARLYGERDTPYQVILRLTNRLDAAIAPDDALAQIVRTIGEGLRLPFAAIELCQDHRFVRAAAWGKPLIDQIEYPITNGDETVGRLLVAPRSVGEGITPGDHQLLTSLVYHAEVAVQTARLTADLQQSREKLVVAREEERRRLRRDLHDGLGPALASLTLQIDAARNLLTRNPARVDPLLVSLKEQIQAALIDIRRLVYELRPPALDELGLMAALHETVHRFEVDGGLQIVIEAPEGLPPLSAATEVAAYRIVQEALTNVVRHAHATTCRLSVKLEDNLRIEVCDNGCGLPEIPRHGVGWSSMVERAAELGGRCVIERAAGGGTRLVAHLPAQTALRMEQLK